MPQGEWRLDAAYADKQSLDPSGFAFEYLRRNPEFIHDQRHLEQLLKRGLLTARMRKAFAQRWGLRFRKVLARRYGANHSLDSGCTTVRRPPYADSGHI